MRRQAGRGVDDCVRVQRDAVDALIHQPFGQIGVIGMALAADTDVLGSGDGHGEQHLDGRVASGISCHDQNLIPASPVALQPGSPDPSGSAFRFLPTQLVAEFLPWSSLVLHGRHIHRLFRREPMRGPNAPQQESAEKIHELLNGSDSLSAVGSDNGEQGCTAAW